MNSTKNIQGVELLYFNHAGVMQLKDGRTINYGVIRVSDKEVVYYTGKGLREMWKPKITEEQKRVAEQLIKIGKEEGGEKKLINSGHIAVTALGDIIIVIS